MGLDMYAYSTATKPATEVDFYTQESDIDIAYWRKHHDLHGWMEQLYRKKGGAAESFNCVNVQLTLEDLTQLEQDLRMGGLPPTTGFFFGNHPPDADSLEGDLVFIAKAREEIQQDHYVYYTSWW